MPHRSWNLTESQSSTEQKWVSKFEQITDWRQQDSLITLGPSAFVELPTAGSNVLHAWEFFKAPINNHFCSLCDKAHEAAELLPKGGNSSPHSSWSCKLIWPLTKLQGAGRVKHFGLTRFWAGSSVWWSVANKLENGFIFHVPLQLSVFNTKSLPLHLKRVIKWHDSWDRR